MQPRNDYSEAAQKHPDFHLVQEEIRALNAKMEELDQKPSRSAEPSATPAGPGVEHAGSSAKG